LWIIAENTVIPEDITGLFKSQYGENVPYHTPLQKSNSIWYTQYLATEGNPSQKFEIPAVWGGNK